MTRYLCSPILAIALTSAAIAADESRPNSIAFVKPDQLSFVQPGPNAKTQLLANADTIQVLASPVMTEVSRVRNAEGEWVATCKIMTQSGQPVGHRHGDDEVH